MWLQGTGAAVGGSIDIGLHEIGLSGEATVLAIGPCDVDSRETRPGMSIVTGTIRHRNAMVWDLTFDGCTEETLGVTANHPLYSETRHAWIPAGDLQLDEVVRTLNGHATLTARTQRPTRETVFNLEVHRSHAYHVSGLGVLAHNTGLPCPPLRPEKGYLGGKKHGIKWQEGKSLATRPDKDGNLTPQGQWGSKADLDWAGQQAATLKPGEGRFFDLPEGHSSIEWGVDGISRPALRAFLRNNGTGTFHGYPLR